MQTTRRRFLHSGLVGSLGMTLGRTLSSGAEAAKTIPIGCQLYAVRGEFSRSVPDTLKALAATGYQGVEFWGYGGTPLVFEQYSAADLRKLLDAAGLRCCGMHLELKAVMPDNLARTIETNQTLGSRYLNVAAAAEKMKSEAGIAELAAILNQASKQCRPGQLVVGYHAHPFDFAKFGDRFAWEILFGQCLPEVNMQMDVGNCLAGKGDPIAMLKEFPGRTRTIHIKEHEEKTFDSPFYREVFRLCETPPAVEWYIVEMGGPDGKDLAIPRDALAKLHRLGK